MQNAPALGCKRARCHGAEQRQSPVPRTFVLPGIPGYTASFWFDLQALYASPPGPGEPLATPTPKVKDFPVSRERPGSFLLLPRSSQGARGPAVTPHPTDRALRRSGTLTLDLLWSLNLISPALLKASDPRRAQREIQQKSCCSASVPSAEPERSLNLRARSSRMAACVPASLHWPATAPTTGTLLSLPPRSPIRTPPHSLLCLSNNKNVQSPQKGTTAPKLPVEFRPSAPSVITRPGFQTSCFWPRPRVRRTTAHHAPAVKNLYQKPQIRVFRQSQAWEAPSHAPSLRDASVGKGIRGAPGSGPAPKGL